MKHLSKSEKLKLDVYVYHMQENKCAGCRKFAAKKALELLKDGESISISKDSLLFKSFMNSLNQPELLKNNKGSEEPF